MAQSFSVAPPLSSVGLKSCRHCGTSFAGAADFCCAGCEAVFSILENQNLSDYYRLREINPPSCPVPAQVSSETYEYCDDPEFIRRASTDGLRLQFFLEGLNCTACLWLLEKLPDLCEDARAVRVNMATSSIEVVRTQDGKFSAIASKLNRLGFRPRALRLNESITERAKKEMRGDLIRLGVAAVATGNIMILAVSKYGGASETLGVQFSWLIALLAAPVLSYSAWPFYKNALSGIRSRHLNLDVPIVAALVAGIVMSLWGLIEGSEKIYLDSISMLVLLLLSSRLWLRGIQRRHLDVSRLENDLLVGTAQRLNESGAPEPVSTLSLNAGDKVLIRGAITIPTDGIVLSGVGIIDSAVLTGEPEPFAISHGKTVEAGSRNHSGEWILEVRKSVSQSRLTEILKETEISARNKPRLLEIADRVSQIFIATTLLAALVVGVYFSLSNIDDGLTRALALIIVTCPCVFGMAIPLSLSLAVRQAARKGIVIKDANVIERLGEIEKIYVDKTGTLTKGEMTVLDMEFFGFNQRELRFVLALEKNETHPVARALTNFLNELRFPEETLTDVKHLSTGGISGNYGTLTYSVRPFEKQLDGGAKGLIRSRYGFYRESTLIACFEIGDEVKPDAAEFVNWAKRQDLEVQILSGDKQSAVQTCAYHIGLSREDAISGATPEKKAEIVKSSSEKSMMIGDGANDASALALSSVGIAVRGSMEVSLRAADIYLVNSKLSSVTELFEIARTARRAIRRNLIFSASFNLVSGSLAVMGLMTPLWAAVLMPLSSVVVLISSLLSKNSGNVQHLEIPGGSRK